MIEFRSQKLVNNILLLSFDRAPMTAARREIPPNEQLWALRHARDRYRALADGLKDDAGFEGTPEEKITRELEARRIAGAYEKSVANMVANCCIRHVDLDAPISASARVRFAILAVLMAAAGAGAYLILPHPDLPRIRVVFEPASGKSARAAEKEERVPGPAPKPPMAVVPQSASFEPSARVPVETRHAIRPAPPRERPSSVPASGPDDGFVAKVLQPDGSLREEYFKTRPAR